MLDARCFLHPRAGLLLVTCWLAWLAPSFLAAQPTADPSPQPQAAPPYSLPFQLRPAINVSVLRLDTAFAFYDDPQTGAHGQTTVPLFTFAYKLTEHFAPIVRLGVVGNDAPVGPGGFGLLNPVLAGTYVLKLTPALKLAFFLGVTLPIGSGGGDRPDPGRKAARTAGIWARSALDNAMFAVNDLTVIPGVDVAYVVHGWTFQLEATVLQLTRVRGAADQPDASRTNFTAGLHVGYFILPWLSAAAELRHQRWLSTPKQLAADPSGALRDTTTLAFGPRFHVHVTETGWLRPGVALVLPLDDPMGKTNHKIIQLDIPFPF